MRCFFYIFIALVCATKCNAQSYDLPYCDKTDDPGFHVEKIEKSKEYTLLHCSYIVEPGFVANISKNAYLEDTVTKRRFNIIKCEGLPFSPQLVEFEKRGSIPIKLYFSSTGNSDIFNLFLFADYNMLNVYGINLVKEPYQRSYKDYEVLRNIRQQEFYVQSGNIMKGIEFCKKSLESKKYYFGSRSSDVGKTLYILASLYDKVGEHRIAIKYAKEGLDIDKANKDVTKEELIGDYNNLSYYYDAIGDYNEGIKALKESLTIFLQGDTLSEQYAHIITMLSKFYDKIGNYSEAYTLAKQSLIIKRDMAGENSNTYAVSLSNLAMIESHLGNYEESIRLSKKSLNILIALNGENDLENSHVLSDISYNYNQLGKYNEAIAYGEKACNLYVFSGIENADFAELLSNLSGNYLMLSTTSVDKSNNAVKKNLSKYSQFADSAQHVAERIPESHLVLPTIYNRKAIHLSLQGKIKDAILYQKKACELTDKSTINFLVLLQNLGIYYLYDKNYKEAISVEKEVVDNFDQRIKENMKSLSGWNMSNYWASINFWYFNYIPQCAFYTKDSLAISFLYDKTALFAKGFLLNSNINIRNLLRNEKSPQIMEFLENNQALYEQLDSLLLVNKDSPQVELIKKEIKDNEDFIAMKSNYYHYYLDKIDCNWQTVHKSLNESDMAIEFIKCPVYLGDDSIVYVALLLKKQYSSPKLLTLFKESQINGIKASVSQDKMYKLIWAPLECELNGVSNIYFSPAGILNNINIENLPDSNGQTMSDRYNIYRLSSTGKLVEGHEARAFQKVALFGGISYDMTENNDYIIESNNTSEAPNTELYSQSNYRSGFEPLNNTLYEIECINYILKEKEIISMLFDSEKGSEYNFKKLSGKDYRIIHLATHGMYIDYGSSQSSYSKNDFLNSSSLYSNDTSGESYALTRSFVVMAGGNRLFKGMTIPPNVNDGILTALEISRLDLHTVDLVVLSACHTGLGDVTNDGVFGLQRGFKKAGVNTIIMSLDKVDDEATQILMVEFYKNLMSGKSKLQSFKEAQMYLRQVDNGKYDKPEYWASFIMLDGLN